MEYACKDVVFHFNKKHLTDPTIPMWVLKTYGETFYVNHVECSVPWSTKETPDNPHTKGSIKVKDCLLTINDNNEATIAPLSLFDKIRLRNQKLGITRIIFTDHFFQKKLKEDNIRHSPIKSMGGGCGTIFYVCDLLESAQVSFIGLKHHGKFRVLQPNEEYYKAYDDTEVHKKLNSEELWDTLFDE
jgi:hypothetical protein